MKKKWVREVLEGALLKTNVSHVKPLMRDLLQTIEAAALGGDIIGANVTQ